MEKRPRSLEFMEKCCKRYGREKMKNGAIQPLEIWVQIEWEGATRENIRGLKSNNFSDSKSRVELKLYSERKK